MFDRTKKFLSHDSGFLAQFVKYGVIGVLATGVQLSVFYVLAATCFKCLAADDWVVRAFGLPATDASSAMRSFFFVLATTGGFFLANIFCWLMNRLFVFRSGKYVWYKEFLFFLIVSGVAMGVAMGLSAWLISTYALMTTLAVILEVFASFVINFVMRKFFIFKG